MDQELHQIEQELHTEILPGTEIMADVGSHHFVKKGDSQVLVPQPSASEHDPLNWTPFWKGLCIAASTSVSFTQGFGPLALAPMFPYYIEDFHSNLADVVKFTGVAILVLGFSNFIWSVAAALACDPGLTCCAQGPDQHIVRSPPRLHPFPAHLSRLIDLENLRKRLQQLHGSLCAQWNRRRSS